MYDEVVNRLMCVCTNRCGLATTSVTATIVAVISAVLLVVGGIQLAFAQPLTEFPSEVGAMLKKHKLSAANLSVYVQDVRESAPLLTVNAQQARNPASVMKVLTTVVALHELGPTFRFRTDVYADTAVDKGIVHGNLYLRGNGDPFLVTESFWRLLKDLRHLGLVHVTGDLVIDGSGFSVAEGYRGDFDGRPSRAYNVLPHATLVNFFATHFKFFADPHNNAVRIVVDPPMSTLQINNRIKLTKARCSRGNRKINMRILQTEPVAKIEFTGKFPKSCGPYELLRAVASPAPFVFGAFKPMWEEIGGRIDGVGREGQVPKSAVHVFRARSRPLAELLRFINKYSNNVMTRNLLLALGAEAYGAPGTLEKGQRAISDWLTLQDLSASQLRVDNGSGLSRHAQVSTLTLARVLVKAWHSELMPEFVSTLPLSALDGTMRKRFKKTDLKGKLHMKTGLLNGVRSIAGFMRTRSGRDLVVVSLQNERGVENHSGTRVQDALLTWLFEQ
ncbi:MAG: D-alanyl-D-alanine carboxypeptidase/D-alanyl-D-alanine-endopeptidase (penicillin-binding protein 4) [Gammaproteobacteria bacterium]|jgi:D-alanyl-D-alanine carboxypeptidase/D-alanyl-D-alanine-endopeptidase (penicillin-binding protein 4)